MAVPLASQWRLCGVIRFSIFTCSDVVIEPENMSVHPAISRPQLFAPLSKSQVEFKVLLFKKKKIK